MIRKIMDSLLKDIRYGLRGMLKHPGFTVIALLTLALGIGANTAMFTVVNAVLLRPLSFPESEKLVALQGINPQKGITASNMSVPDLADWRAQNHVFEQLAGFVSGSVFLTNGDDTERARATGVSAEFFPMLRVQPLTGRTVQPEDEEQGRQPVAVLSYALWQRKFGGDPKIVNSQIQVNNKSTTVIGVMPAGFEYPDRSEVWTPLPINPASEARVNRFVSASARLKPGVTIEEAQNELNTINQRLAHDYVDSNFGWTVKVTDMRESFVGDLRSSLLILFGAVVFVLLIACANVANLLLSRAAFRQKEIAVRIALGASRLRIVRQLLTESVLLSLISGIIGIGLRVWLTRLLIYISPANSPRFEEIGIDPRVLLFTLGVSILTGIIFGMAPVFQSSRPQLNETLKESGRLGSQGGTRNRIGSMLMVAEIAFSFVLLAGATLLIKSFLHLRQIDPGFNTNNVLVTRAALPPGKYANGEPRARIFQEVVDRVRAMPGVLSAGAVLSLPLGGDTFNVGREILREGEPDGPQHRHGATYLVVTPGYFKTLQIPIKAGREFGNEDANANAAKAMIINETMARNLWPGESAIGRRVKLDSDEKFFREIVGVVGDTRASLDTPPSPQMYVPYAQDANWGSLSLVIKTSGEPTSVASALRNEVRTVDKGIPLFNLRTMEEVVATSSASRRLPMMLLSAFAAVAMVLSMLGIYGVTAYYVTQRTREIGIRIALGAQVGDVLSLILKRGVILSLVGLILGFAGSIALTRYLTSLLFGVEPFDTFTFACVSVVLIAVCLVACLVPARRATKVDPLVALRYE